MNRYISYTINFLLVLIVWFGFVDGNIYAQNLSKFALWFFCIMWILITITSPTPEIASALKNSYNPKKSRMLLFLPDVVICLILATMGNFFYAALAIFQGMLGDVMFVKSKTLWEASCKNSTGYSNSVE